MNALVLVMGLWLLVIGYLDWQFFRMIGVSPVIGLISILLGSIGIGLVVASWLTM